MTLPQARAARISLVFAVFVLALKFTAFVLTGSVSLLSDAAESVVNVLAAVVLLLVLRLAGRPADYEHPYGHKKAELFSATFEALLIFAAGALIISAGIQRLLSPRELDNLPIGLAVAALAAAVNLAVALWLRKQAHELDSEGLSANARHLFIDVWSTAGVLLAVVLVNLTGWLVLDPLVAILVGVNILREGWLIMSRSLSQLLDERLPETEEAVILRQLDATDEILGYHRLRSRRSGSDRFVEVDVFLEPDMTVAQAHSVVRELEQRLGLLLPNLVATIHVEPHAPGVREGKARPRDEF